MLAHRVGRVLIHLASFFSRLIVVAEMHSRRRYRHDRGLNVVLVHQRDRGVGAPLRNRQTTSLDAFFPQPRRVRWRYYMMMSVDASASRHDHLRSYKASYLFVVFG